MRYLVPVYYHCSIDQTCQKLKLGPLVEALNCQYPCHMLVSPQIYRLGLLWPFNIVHHHGTPRLDQHGQNFDTYLGFNFRTTKFAITNCESASFRSNVRLQRCQCRLTTRVGGQGSGERAAVRPFSKEGLPRAPAIIALLWLLAVGVSPRSIVRHPSASMWT